MEIFQQKLSVLLASTVGDRCKTKERFADGTGTGFTDAKLDLAGSFVAAPQDSSLARCRNALAMTKKATEHLRSEMAVLSGAESPVVD